MEALPADPSDESRHPPTDEHLWSESYYLDFVSDDARLGGYVRTGLCPNLGVTWQWACLVGEGRPLVVFIDHDLPLPEWPGLTLPEPGPGLRSEIITASPLEQMNVDLEVPAAILSDATAVYRDEVGVQTKLAFDLEWHTDGGTFAYDLVTRYEVPCRVHGTVAVGDESLDFEGWGQRDHSWGVRDWWSFGWCWSAGRLSDGTRFHGTVTSLGYVTGYVGEPEGGTLDRFDTGSVRPVLDGEGLAEHSGLVLGGLALDVAPVAWAPVLLESPDGRRSRFPRALCQYRAKDGREGAGWIEFNQPQT